VGYDYRKSLDRRKGFRYQFFEQASKFQGMVRIELTCHVG
jgi:hypothetical protein